MKTPETSSSSSSSSSSSTPVKSSEEITYPDTHIGSDDSLQANVQILDFTELAVSQDKIARSFSEWTAQHKYVPARPEKHPDQIAIHMTDGSQHTSKLPQLNSQVPMSKREEFAACLLLIVFPGIIIWLPVLAIVLLTTIQWNIIFPILAFISIASLIAPVVFVPSICGCYMLRLFARYFSMRMIFVGKAAKLKLCRQYIFAHMPHGVFPIGDMLTLFAFRSLCFCVPRFASSWALVRTPILRNIFGAFGAISASPDVLAETLCDNFNVSINLPGVGGIYDGQYVNPSTGKREQQLRILERRGFIRLALKNNRKISIVPVYMFGNTECLNAVFGGNRFIRWLSRKVRFPITWMYGRLGLPLPRRIPILIAYGEPIEISNPNPHEEPSAELITQYHEKFITAVTNLYMIARRYYGWDDVALNFCK
jgi:hypothetical protein